MKKIFEWIKSHLPTKRRLIQLYCALLFNANIKGFVTGQIYKGSVKNICTPGLNCYSCPGATGACPMGALQNALSTSGKRTPYYVIGIILLYSILFGRMICGFFCPFGLVQELLYKIKTPKLKKSKVTKVLSYFKYVILVFMVVIVPILYMFKDRGIPAFCKYICPAGILEGAVGLLSHVDNAAELVNLGPLFTWKFSLFVVFIFASVFIFRFFCRFFCPLGALYGLFNRFSILGIRLEKDKCISCGRCKNVCKVDISHVGDHECVNCGDCLAVCPTNAITWRGSKIFLPPNVTDEEKALGRPLTSDEAAAVEKKAEKVKKRSLITKIVAASLAGAVLIGSLVYFNFIYKEPEYVGDCVDADGDRYCDICKIEIYCIDADANGKCDDCKSKITSEDMKHFYGNQRTEECIGAHLEVLDENGLTGEIFNPATNRGKITIINFWGVWCDGCIKELPDFNRIANEYADKVTVVAVHTADDREKAPDWIKEHYSDWDNIIFALDEKINGANADSYYTALGFTSGGYPVSVILKPNGTISKSHNGIFTYDQLKAEIEDILKFYE